MPDDDVSLDEIYAEVDKRVKAAVDAQTATLTALITALEAKIPKAKESLRILRKRS